MDQIQSYFSSNKGRFIEDWKRFLAFASISADPAYDGACLDCAKWLVEHLSGIGFQAELLPTETKPMVYGELPGDPSKPTVLFYGHYDVQPIDPRELWSSDPFGPVLRDDGRLYARGAQDNKGQVAYFLKGVEALRACGSALPTIKVLLEGEEESGSRGMYAHLESHREQIKADILMVCDTGTLAPGVPTITMGLRGVAHFDVRVFGPNADIHSGVYGGVVLNPIQALCGMLSSLHRSDGSIAVPGFYDGVVEPSEQDRALANAAPLEVAQLVKELGVDLEGGEGRYTVIERRGFRPTVEINGIGGGYQGEGTKTVIPSTAFAKISTRLVKGQDPQRVLDSLTSHLKSCAPRGVRVEVCHERVGGAGFGLSTSSPLIEKAREALARAFGRDPVFMWEGASVPVIPFLSEVSGAEPLLIGFGLPEDRIHSPNESFSLQQFEDGYRYVTTFLSSL